MVKRKGSGLQLASLPTDILCKILSQLPIKEAVRTSILSAQWRYAWCCHSNLDFSFRFEQESTEGVESVLQQHSGLVDNIQFVGPFGDEQREQIERWVNFATASKAKQLILDFSPARPKKLEPCGLDLQLLDESNSLHLRAIKLCRVSLKMPLVFKGFQKLRWIYLADMDITDEGLKSLISNSTVLEFLGIAGITGLRTLQISSDTLQHLQVYDCHRLGEMELNILGLVKLEYRGPRVLLSPPGTLLTTNIRMELVDACSLECIFIDLGNNVPDLETLTVKCTEWKRPELPRNLHSFVHLKHLSMELNIAGNIWNRKTDILDFAVLLVAAPFLEKLGFHMFVGCEHQRYSTEEGNVRSPPYSEPHIHLRTVEITGFYGQKDQLGLALHILENSVVLEEMEINPSPAVLAADRPWLMGVPAYVMDGCQVALQFLRGRDHRNVVRVVTSSD